MVSAQDNKGALYGGNAARVERENHPGENPMIIRDILLIPVIAFISGILCFFNPPLSPLVSFILPSGTHMVRCLLVG